LLVFLSFAACAADEPPVPALTGRVERETFPSTIVNDAYLIEVRLPPSYDQLPARSYPVVFQLDGTNFGPEFAITAGFASGLEGQGRISETIVVGVGYPYVDPLISSTQGRGRDYVPVSFDGKPGGLDPFVRFLVEELLPHIDSKYRVDSSRRILSGHSLGGFVSLYTLFTTYQKPAPPFWGFIGGDPSLGEADYRLLDEETALHALTSSLPIPLYLEIARFDGAVQRLSFQALDERLRAHYPDLRYASELRDTDHPGTIRPSFQNGLLHLLGGAK